MFIFWDTAGAARKENVLVRSCLQEIGRVISPFYCFYYYF